MTISTELLQSADTTPQIIIPTPQQVQRELFRRRKIEDPVLWSYSQLDCFLWSKQRHVIRSVRDNKRTSVRSCHASGKSRLGAIAVLWFLRRFPPGDAFVITTAPTFRQVRIILWREIGHLFPKSGITGKISQTELKIRHQNKEHIVAIGQKPDDADDSAFQGLHSKNVLIILDEASGVAKVIWDAAESIISGGHGRILAIGNPTRAGSEFHKTFKPRSGYNNIHISAFDTPNFTDEEVPQELRNVLVNREYQERMLERWGEDGNEYKARVLGVFPDSNEFGFFSDALVEAAKERTLDPTDDFPVLGCDIGAGGDPTVICLRRGPVARIIKVSYEPDAEKTGKLIVDLIDKYNAHAVIDSIGPGAPAWAVAKNLRSSKVSECKYSQDAKDPENYHNLKAELFSGVRDRLVEGNIDLDKYDDELSDEMSFIEARTDPLGRILIEPKEQIRRRLKRSTDRLDALVYSFAYRPAHGVPIVVGRRDGPRYN